MHVISAVCVYIVVNIIMGMRPCFDGKARGLNSEFVMAGDSVPAHVQI